MEDGEEGKVIFRSLDVEVLLFGHKTPSLRAPYNVRVLNPQTKKEIVDELTELERIALKSGAKYVILDSDCYQRILDTVKVKTPEKQVVRNIRYQRKGCDPCKD